MNLEQSNKYIELVKNGNKDDMFDYGKEIGVEDFKKRLVEEIYKEINSILSMANHDPAFSRKNEDFNKNNIHIQHLYNEEIVKYKKIIDLINNLK